MLALSMLTRMLSIAFVSLSVSSSVFTYNTATIDSGCNSKNKRFLSPEIEEQEYVHSSLVPFRLWLVNYLNKKENKPTLTLEQCLSISFFLRVYAWGGEPCAKRSLTELYSWVDYCATKWLDPEYVRYDTGGCYIYDVPILTDQVAATIITRYLINNPECRILTPEELREKINKKAIEEAKKLLLNPEKIYIDDNKNKFNIPVPSCEKIVRPSLWTKILKWPKNIFNFYSAQKLVSNAINFAASLNECYQNINGKADAIRTLLLDVFDVKTIWRGNSTRLY